MHLPLRGGAGALYEVAGADVSAVLVEGALSFVDTGVGHRVANLGPAARDALVVDCVADAELLRALGPAPPLGRLAIAPGPHFKWDRAPPAWASVFLQSNDHIPGLPGLCATIGSLAEALGGAGPRGSQQPGCPEGAPRRFGRDAPAPRRAAGKRLE